MKKFAFLSLLGAWASVSLLWSQVTVGSNNPPDPSAILDIQSNSGGLLYPRLTTAQRNAILSPANGLTIYNTTTNCLQTYFPSSGWQDIKCDCQSFPSSAFTFPGNIGANTPSAFNATTPGLTYSWTFQGGSPATGTNQTETVTWPSAGTYTVTLTVTDNQGCSSTTTQNVVVSNCPGQPLGQTATFNYTGSQQSFVVPNCVYYIDIDAYGAQGHAVGSTNHGRGGRVQARLTVTPGETIYIYVGGAGVNTTGGWNGGGNGGSSTYGAGGGASDLRRGGTTLNDRILVAGGGGGTGANCGQNSAPGGPGGGLTGGSGCTYSCSSCQYTGAGGTQSAGGIAGPTSHSNCGGNQNGSFGLGGNNTGSSGTGGGGGWYGGGSGCYEGAGGGSSYVTINGSSNITHTQGVRNGNGQIVITY